MSDLFHDRLQRYLDGELSEAETLELLRTVAEDRAARLEFLEEKELHHDLRRLLNPGASDTAIVRGVLHAKSGERKGSSTLIRQVLETYAVEKKQGARKRVLSIGLAAAGVVAAIVLWLSGSRDERRPDVTDARSQGSPSLKDARHDRPNDEKVAPDRDRSPEPESPLEPAPPRTVPAVRPDPKEIERPEQPLLQPERKPVEEQPSRPAPVNPPEDPDKAKPPSRDTVPFPKTGAVIARLSVVTGQVHLVTEGGKTQVQAGQPIAAGQGLTTSGSSGFAMVTFSDSTCIEVWPDTTITRLSDRAGKEIVVERGAVLADVSRQPKDRPLVIATPQGKARVLGTILRVMVDSAGAGSTTVEVDSGIVQFTASQKAGNSVELTAGTAAVAISGGDVKFKARPPQDGKKGKQANATDPRVDAAIRKGVEFLRAAPSPGHNGSPDADDLVLWTYVHAGVPETDPKFRELLKKVLEAPLVTTYTVALRAMILEELNRVAYQGAIHRCAQFLVDNQCANGQWTYGTPTQYPDYPKDLPTGELERPDVASGKRTAKGATATSELLRTKPKVLRKLSVKKMREGPASGDNSNSQYAALGLRACHDAGIVIPAEVVARAKEWWVSCQVSEEAKGYTGGSAGGWGYSKGAPGSISGSMTAGAVGAVVIYDYMKGSDWKKDPVVQAGVNWLALHFTVTENPEGGKATSRFHYYYLYALERAGIFYGTEHFGRNAWYAEGSKVILEAQKPDGSWVIGRDNPTWDTCFAILFLRRATRPLTDVASEDRNSKK